MEGRQEQRPRLHDPQWTDLTLAPRLAVRGQCVRRRVLDRGGPLEMDRGVPRRNPAEKDGHRPNVDPCPPQQWPARAGNGRGLRFWLYADRLSAAPRGAACLRDGPL